MKLGIACISKVISTERRYMYRGMKPVGIFQQSVFDYNKRSKDKENIS